MRMLEQELGKCVTAEELADYLHCDVSDVQQSWQQLGGLQVGNATVFLERRIADAILQRTKEQLDSPDCARRQKVQKSAPDKESGVPVGGSQKVGTVKSRKRRLSPDVHGILV
jgi:hypothetical protein